MTGKSDLHLQRLEIEGSCPRSQLDTDFKSFTVEKTVDPRGTRTRCLLTKAISGLVDQKRALPRKGEGARPETGDRGRSPSTGTSTGTRSMAATAKTSRLRSAQKHRSFPASRTIARLAAANPHPESSFPKKELCQREACGQPPQFETTADIIEAPRKQDR